MRLDYSLPAGPFVAEVEFLWMKDLGKDFQRFDQARARAVEELVTIRDKDAAGLGGAQLVPIGSLGQWLCFPSSTRQIEATWQSHDDVWIILP
jgi:hypothetical protein